jgi:methionyl aminopeptidase
MSSTIPGMSYDERSEEERQYYLRKAGQILYEVFEEVRPMVKPGSKVIDICNTAEKLIFEKGARPSFPCNVSINYIAAHYTSSYNDETVIPEASIVKLDMGTHLDGFIADKADTFCFAKELEPLKEASRAGWNAGMELMKPELETSMIGVATEDAVKEHNYRTIRELAGHLLERYRLHGGKSLPNVRIPFAKANSVVEEKEAYAFEVFATTGGGSVHDVKPKTYIYMLMPRKVPVRSRESKAIRNFTFNEYSTMPFASRWLQQNPKFNPGRVRLTLNEMIRNGGLYEYSVLAEEKDAFVSQYEESFIITEDKYEITTLPPFDFKMPESLKEKDEKKEEEEKDEKKD